MLDRKLILKFKNEFFGQTYLVNFANMKIVFVKKHLLGYRELEWTYFYVVKV